MKLERKHLAPYLPFDLKGQAKHLDNQFCELAGIGRRLGNSVDIEYGTNQNLSKVGVSCGMSNFTPILRPLKDLATEGKEYSLTEIIHKEITENHYSTKDLITGHLKNIEGQLFGMTDMINTLTQKVEKIKVEKPNKNFIQKLFNL